MKLALTAREFLGESVKKLSIAQQIADSLNEGAEKDIFYHGTSSTKKAEIIKSGFKINPKGKQAIYISKDKNIASSYGYNKDENVIPVNIKGLNIKYIDRPPRSFFDLSRGDIEKYVDDGYDGIGISNGSEIAIFDPKKLRIEL